MSAAPLATGRSQDWLLSLGLHGLLLAAAALPVWQQASTPPVQRLDLPLQWAEPSPTPAPAPPPPAVPPPRPTVSPLQTAPTPPAPSPVPQRTPTPQPASPLPETATATPSATPYAAPTTPAPAAPDVRVAATPAPVATSVARPAEAAPAPAPAPVPDPGAERRWQAHLETLLARDRHYPVSARRARQEGVVLIEAHFTADGQLTRCAIHSSSGFAVLDEAALAMVRRAAEAVRLQHAPGRLAQLRIPITFQLEES